MFIERWYCSYCYEVSEGLGLIWRLLNVFCWEVRIFCFVEDGQLLTNFEKGLDNEVCVEQLRGCGRRLGQRFRVCVRVVVVVVFVNKIVQVREGEGIFVGMSNINKVFRDCIRISVQGRFQCRVGCFRGQGFLNFVYWDYSGRILNFDVYILFILINFFCLE